MTTLPVGNSEDSGRRISIAEDDDAFTEIFRVLGNQNNTWQFCEFGDLFGMVKMGTLLNG